MSGLRRLRNVLIAIVVASVAVQAPAQDRENEVFVRQIVEVMRAYGWQDAELESLTMSMRRYRWEHMTGVDPEAVALAVRYGRESGLVPADSEATAQWTYELADAARQMVRYGMGPREVARTSINTMRALVTDRGQERVVDEPSVTGVHIREQVRTQVRSQQTDALRTGVRSRLSGPTGQSGVRFRAPVAPGAPSAPGGPNTGSSDTPGGSGSEDSPGSIGGGVQDPPAGGPGPGPGESAGDSSPGNQGGGSSGGAR